MFVAGFPAGSFQANCYVVAAAPGAPCLVIDPGEAATDRLAQVLDEQRLRPAAVLLTHGHLDHTASGAVVADAHGIPLYIHSADEYMLDDPLAALSAELRAALSGLQIPSLRAGNTLQVDGAGPPVLDGVSLRVIATPGHTQGSVVYAIAAADDRPEVLFTGDTLFAGTVGRSDLAGGDHRQLIASITSELLPLRDDAVVLPGHGPASTIGAERAGNPFLAG